MKKIWSLLLALLLITSMMVSMIACKDDPVENPDDDPSNESADTPGNNDEEETPVERIPLSYLPEDTYNDTEFHILQWSANGQTEVSGTGWISFEEGYVPERDGNALNSAVFARNAWVEQTYDIRITAEYSSVDGSPDIFTRIRNDATASTDEFQLITMRTIQVMTLIEEGLYADMNEYPELLHTDQPWWVADSVASFTLGEHLYVASSEMLLRDKGATSALYFNQDMAKDYTVLPDFFQLAKDGLWTFEEFLDACETVAQSADGNDLMDSENDIWGCYGGDDPVYYLYNSLGYKFGHINDDGYIEYDFGQSDDSITVLQDIFDEFMYSGWYMNTQTVGKQIGATSFIFTEGHSLFDSRLVKQSTGDHMKNMEDLYGILPQPKLDEDQENYSSLVWMHHDCVVGIPSHAANKDMCAVILEALSWEGYYSVYPVFYDTILLNRAARDEESKEMLKIIFDTRSYDPGQYWDSDSGLHSGGQGILRLSATGNSDIVSVWKTFESKVMKNIDDVNEWIDAKAD